MHLEIIEERGAPQAKEAYNRWVDANSDDMEVVNASFHTYPSSKVLIAVWYRKNGEAASTSRRKRRKESSSDSE